MCPVFCMFCTFNFPLRMFEIPWLLVLSFPDLIGESRPFVFYKLDQIVAIPYETWLQIIGEKFKMDPRLRGDDILLITDFLSQGGS